MKVAPNRDLDETELAQVGTAARWKSHGGHVCVKQILMYIDWSSTPKSSNMYVFMRLTGK